MVRMTSEYTGRGPTKARTFMHPNVIVCLLEDTLTKGERSLVANGEEDTVLATRKTFQKVMREDASSMVEELTGRKVIAVLSDNHVDPDLAVETFVLEPMSENGRPA